MLVIKEIEKNSIGEEIGLEVGDVVLKFAKSHSIF